MESTQQQDLVQSLREMAPYPTEAYDFVEEGLAHTQERAFEEEPMLPHEERHIRGQELCIGLRNLAIARWGLMAPVVLKHWNIHRTEDFGRIVFALVEDGVMSKTPDDTIEDFRGVYDFDEAFCREALLADISID